MHGASQTDSVAGGACTCSASIRLDVGVLDHPFPHTELIRHESSQLLRCAGKSFETHVFELRLDVRAIDDVAQCSIEFRHDRRWGSGRRDNPGPSIEIEALYSRLVHGRQVRIQGATMNARY